MHRLTMLIIGALLMNGCKTENLSSAHELSESIHRHDKSDCITGQKSSIKHAGFSIHDGLETLITLLLSSNTEMVPVCTE